MISADDLLNGSPISPVAGVRRTGRANGGTPAAAAPTATRRASPQTVLIVWFILFALLILSHVLTLQLQR